MKRLVTILFSFTALCLIAIPAQAQTCMEDQAGGSQNCTANDTNELAVSVLSIIENCPGGNPDSATVNVSMLIGGGNATSRYDVGVFVAKALSGDALTGQCFRSYAQSGDNGASDSGDGDACWDRVTATPITMVRQITIECPASGDTEISICATWGQNNSAVDSTGGDGQCTTVGDLRPGTTAKCACSVVNLGNLPVELTSFSGQVDGQDVTLRWETASETNNAGYSVEHSYRGSPFQEVGFVTGAGTSLNAQSYSFELPDLNAGKHLFRLRQIDFDGAFEYSAEIELTVGVPGKFMLEAAYPNPFNPGTTINFLVAVSSPVTVELYNILGVHVRTLYDGTPNANETQTIHIDGANLPSGIYVVRLVGQNFSGSQQIMLVK